MKVRHLILMLLDASGGQIYSKTKLQKQIYFLSLSLEEDFGYKAHYYGPYSTEVEQGLDELVGAGFVQVNRCVYGIDYSKGFELKKYKYSLTNSGKKFAEELIEVNPDEYKHIQVFINILQEVGNPDYLSLSIAAKAFFIMHKEGEPITKIHIVDKANAFGWLIKEDHDINQAVNLLMKLNLIKEK